MGKRCLSAIKINTNMHSCNFRVLYRGRVSQRAIKAISDNGVGTAAWRGWGVMATSKLAHRQRQVLLQETAAVPHAKNHKNI